MASGSGFKALGVVFLGGLGFRGIGGWKFLRSAVLKAVQRLPGNLHSRIRIPAWRFMGSYKWGHK